MSHLLYFSSGIGLTAVIIALDALYKHGLVTGVINIQEFTRKMRNDRIGMIQNLVTVILTISRKIKIWDGIRDNIWNLHKVLPFRLFSSPEIFCSPVARRLSVCLSLCPSVYLLICHILILVFRTTGPFFNQNIALGGLNFVRKKNQALFQWEMITT